MGYEIEIMVVQHRNGNLCSDGWFQVLARLDLSKPGEGSILDLLRKYRAKQANIPKKNKYFFYDDYGKREFKVSQDKYGDHLPLVPIGEFYEALLKNNAAFKERDGHSYRRFDLAAALLKLFVEGNAWKYERLNKELYVTAWGH
ncbi:MAG: hypothetical protein WC325_12715 [Candidatus Bathyarchaeia archaeon]|jgi:hypothetical protein